MVKDLVLEDVDDNSNQDSNDGSINPIYDELQRNGDENAVNPDLLNEISQPVEDILDKNMTPLPEGNEIEVANGKNADSEQRKEEMMRMMDIDFPEFKMKSEEFFQDNVQWNDPLCYEGIKEAQRLNRILSEKIEKEKEVKHQGVLLRQKLYEELLAIKQQGRQEQQEERANTQKFLALTFLPEKRKLKIESPEPDTEQTSDSTCSVFQTELNESDAIPKSNEKNPVPELDLSNSETIDYSKQRSTLSETLSENRCYEYEAKHKTKKNFLKRNIQLAKDANSVVAMTSSEKKRIEVLLEDLDSFSDCGHDIESNCLWNTSSMSFPLSEGFTSNREDKALMSLIDSKLKSLLSENEFKSVASSQRSTSSTQRAFIAVVPPSDSEALKYFGEKALLDSKEERAMKERLKIIDKDIMAIYNDPVTDDPIKLDENTLLELLESCASSMSACVSSRSDGETSSCLQETFSESECSNDTSRNRSVSRNLALLIESPPCLSEEILQRLLKDAVPRNSCLSTPCEFIHESKISSRIGADEEYRENTAFTDCVCPGDFYFTTERSSLHSSLQDHFLPEISSSRSLVEVENNL